MSWGSNNNDSSSRSSSGTSRSSGSSGVGSGKYGIYINKDKNSEEIVNSYFEYFLSKNN